MTKQIVEDSSLVAVANAIRSKSGTADLLLFPSGFISTVENIKLGESAYALSSNLYSFSLPNNNWSSNVRANLSLYTSTRSNLFLNSNLCIKVRSGYTINRANGGNSTVKYMSSVSYDLGAAIKSMGGNNLPDGKYYISYIIGTDKGVSRYDSISISDGVVQSKTLSEDIYASTSSSPSVAKIYVTAIIKS